MQNACTYKCKIEFAHWGEQLMVLASTLSAENTNSFHELPLLDGLTYKLIHIGL